MLSNAHLLFPKLLKRMSLNSSLEKIEKWSLESCEILKTLNHFSSLASLG